MQLKLLGWCRFGLTWSVPAGSAVASLTDYYLDTIDALYAVSAAFAYLRGCMGCAGSVLRASYAELLGPKPLPGSCLAACAVCDARLSGSAHMQPIIVLTYAPAALQP